MALRLMTSWDSLKETEVRFRPELCLAALGLYLVLRLLSPIVWSGMLASIGAPRPPYVRALSIDARAWLGRYLPGKLWVVGSKVWLGRDLGIGLRPLAVASLSQLCLASICGTTTGVICLGVASRMGMPTVPLAPVVGFVVLGVTGLSPPVFRRLLSLLARILRRPPIEGSEVLGARGIARALTIVLPVNLGAVAYWSLLVAALSPGATPGLLLYGAGAGIVAGTVGMLALFAPAGLGVREGVMTGIMALALPLEIGIAFALLARVMAVLGDALAFAVSVVVRRASVPE
jgi:hypothetical protein